MTASSDVTPSTRRRHYLLWGSLALLGLGSVLGWLLWPTAMPAVTAEPPQRVTTVFAQPAELTRKITVSGALVPADEIAVGTALQELRIAEVLVEEGDQVVAGQLLARLEADNVDAQQRQAQAALNRARAAIHQQQAQYHEAQTTLQRMTTLGQKGAISQQQLEGYQAQAASTKAILAAAQAEAQQAEAQLAESQYQRGKVAIRAPVTGVVSERLARLGAMSGTDPLFRLVREGRVELEGELSETELAQIHPGLAVTIWGAGQHDAIMGQVHRIIPKVDQHTRLGRLRITLPSTPLLRSGGYATGQIILEQARLAIAVPVSALMTTPEGATSVMTVDSTGLVTQRQVSVGRRNEEWVEIVAGLDPQQQVIARATAFVHEGDTVTPSPTSLQATP